MKIHQLDRNHYNGLSIPRKRDVRFGLTAVFWSYNTNGSKVRTADAHEYFANDRIEPRAD